MENKNYQVKDGIPKLQFTQQSLKQQNKEDITTIELPKFDEEIQPLAKNKSAQNKIKNYHIMIKLIAEAFGTFFIILSGTATIISQIIIYQESNILINAISSGFSICIMIWALGDISGSHFNPAVSLGFLSCKQISIQNCILYLISQFIGSIASVYLEFYIFSKESINLLLPQINENFSIGSFKIIIIEGILTFLLMFIIINTYNQHKLYSQVGLTVGVNIYQNNSFILIKISNLVGNLIFGIIEGSFMNPFRALAPAIVTNNYKFIWQYCIGQICGAQLAVFICWILKRFQREERFFNYIEQKNGIRYHCLLNENYMLYCSNNACTSKTQQQKPKNNF